MLEEQKRGIPAKGSTQLSKRRSLVHDRGKTMSDFFSGLPFGPSIYFLFVLGLFPAGLLAAVFSVTRRFGCGLLLLGVFLLGMEVLGPEIEHNPRVVAKELTGIWKDGSDKLVLNEDGTYVFTRKGKEYTGTWENDDWNLNLSPGLSHVGFYPRVIMAGSTLRIPTNYRNIDLWDGDLGLSR